MLVTITSKLAAYFVDATVLIEQEGCTLGSSQLSYILDW